MLDNIVFTESKVFPKPQHKKETKLINKKKTREQSNGKIRSLLKKCTQIIMIIIGIRNHFQKNYNFLRIHDIARIISPLQ